MTKGIKQIIWQKGNKIWSIQKKDWIFENFTFFLFIIIAVGNWKTHKNYINIRTMIRKSFPEFKHEGRFTCNLITEQCNTAWYIEIYNYIYIYLYIYICDI